MWYRGWEYISIKEYYYADDGTKSHRMPRHKSENDSFIAHLLGGSRGNRYRLRIHHFPHYSSGAVGRAHQNRVDAKLLRSDSLQTAKQRIRGSVAAGERYPQPTEECAEERIEPPRARECQPQHSVQSRVARYVAQP